MTAYQIPDQLRRFVDFLAANPSPANVEAGKFYLVPCARHSSLKWRGRLQNVPLIGTVHEDRDIVKFNPWHIHVDTRFINIPLNMYGLYLGSPLCLTGHGWLDPDGDELWDRPNRWADCELLMRRMKARTAHPPEWPTQMATFFPALEDAYASCRATNGLCPHRQMPLATGRDMGNGVRQCSGHGLCWDASGAMVRRAAEVPT